MDSSFCVTHLLRKANNPKKIGEGKLRNENGSMQLLLTVRNTISNVYKTCPSELLFQLTLPYSIIFNTRVNNIVTIVFRIRNF